MFGELGRNLRQLTEQTCESRIFGKLPIPFLPRKNGSFQGNGKLKSSVFFLILFRNNRQVYRIILNASM